jgi:phenylpropionate dioxygenase-like ring-hydroxylating dioxygenase large terminal subunit
MFLQNCWYLAAWADELAPGAMLARRIAGVHVLFVRDTDGSAHALADTCPHRLVPLSRGSCAGGVVTCAYHGLRFGADGKCVENPHGAITAALAVQRFGCVERHTALWLWLGSSEPDPALIPDYGFIDATPPEARVKGTIHSRADYRLMIDNIMDLTHADYLHATSLGGGINTRARAEVAQQDDEVTIVWTAEDDLLAPMHAQALGPDVTRGDLYNAVLWQAPGNMVQRIKLARPHQMATEALDSMTCHVMTPEAEGSTHYFFCHTSDGVTAHPEIAPMIHAGLMAAFTEEDAPMLAAQTVRLAGRDFWELKPALLPSDKGAVLARRTLDRLIAQENTA